MQSSQIIEIPTDKRKLKLLLFASLAFVLLGCLILLAPAFVRNASTVDLIIVVSGGVLCIGFFGFGSVFFLKKLGDPTPALVISEYGIVDNSSAISFGFVPWSDVKEISEVSSVGQRFVNVVLKDPRLFIDRLPGGWKKGLVKMNYRFFKTVISISPNALKYDFDQLKNLLKERLELFNKTKQS